MKFVFSGSLLIICLFSLVFETGLTSCSKDKTIYDTVTVVETDTVVVKDTIIKADTIVTAEILSAHPWKLQEIRGVDEGEILYYLRGGSSNTTSYDNEYYSFNADLTGTEVDDANVTRQITSGALTGSQIKKLEFTYHIDATHTMVITWDNLRFKNDALYYDEYYTNPVAGNDFHGQAIRIAK